MARPKGSKNKLTIAYQTVGTVSPNIGTGEVTFYCLGKLCKMTKEQVDTILDCYRPLPKEREGLDGFRS